MRYVGIDLHKRFLVACVQDDAGCTLALQQMECRDTSRIARFFDTHRPFRAVIEASSGYRWLYDLLTQRGRSRVLPPSAAAEHAVTCLQEMGQLFSWRVTDPLSSEYVVTHSEQMGCSMPRNNQGRKHPLSYPFPAKALLDMCC